jgi:hypothetical protein
MEPKRIQNLQNGRKIFKNAAHKTDQISPAFSSKTANREIKA